MKPWRSSSPATSGAWVAAMLDHQAAAARLKVRRRAAGDCRQGFQSGRSGGKGDGGLGREFRERRVARPRHRGDWRRCRSNRSPATGSNQEPSRQSMRGARRHAHLSIADLERRRRDIDAGDPRHRGLSEAMASAMAPLPGAQIQNRVLARRSAARRSASSTSSSVSGRGTSTAGRDVERQRPKFPVARQIGDRRACRGARSIRSAIGVSRWPRRAAHRRARSSRTAAAPSILPSSNSASSRGESL